MTRTSDDEIKDGRVHHGFDYQLQVWVVAGFVQPCAHPESMRAHGQACCHQHTLAGQHISTIEWAEEFDTRITSRD